MNKNAFATTAMIVVVLLYPVTLLMASVVCPNNLGFFFTRKYWELINEMINIKYREYLAGRTQRLLAKGKMEA